jgi:hypothetical protein
MSADRIPAETPDVAYATNITIDYQANRLHIAAFLATESGSGIPGMLDIGASGRLIGVEFADRYISVMDIDPDGENLVRSVEIPLDLVWNERTGETVVSFDRRSATHEISYPSGNQCWVRPNAFGADGQPIRTCAAISRDGDAAIVPRVHSRSAGRD